MWNNQISRILDVDGLEKNDLNLKSWCLHSETIKQDL